jgi:hypothetical protein
MILILKMKHGDYPVYARDDAERDRAYLRLFNVGDDNEYYSYDLDEDEAEWCAKARQGDARAARCLLGLRSDRGCEYERIEVICPEVP